MKKILQYVLIEAIFLTFLALGTVYSNRGAANVVIFFTWFTFIISLFYMSDTFLEKVRTEDPDRFSFVWLPVSCDIAAILLMVWYGWIWTAIATVLRMALAQYARAELAKPSVKEGEVA